MMRKAYLVCLIACALLIPAWAGEDVAVRSDLLVSTAWLAQHLNDPNVVVLHVGGKPESYQAAHIPGARHLDVDSFVSMEPEPTHELPPVDKLKRTFEVLGVSDNSRVVLYADDWHPTAARAYFTLDYLGHSNVAMLDGGIHKWKAERRALSSEPPKVKAGSLTPRPQPQILALLQQVRKVVDSESAGAVLVDARPPERYRAGHIPGAAPVFWEQTVVSKENPVLKPAAELRQLYASHGLTAGKRAVTYCEVGFQSSHAYFVLKYLGYDAVNYDGSYREWQRGNNLPVVSGEKRR